MANVVDGQQRTKGIQGGLTGHQTQNTKMAPQKRIKERFLLMFISRVTFLGPTFGV